MSATHRPRAPWRYLWALPNTVLGLVLGGLSFQRPRLDDGVIVFDRAARGFLWVFSKSKWRAITYGHVILSTRRLEGRLRSHELHHVRQYEALGPLFLPLYLAVFAVRGYKKHPLEVAASRAAALEVRPAGPSGGPA